MHPLPHLSRRPWWLSACVLAAGLGVAGGCLAEVNENGVPNSSALRLSGFGTLGVSHTSAPPDWGYQRESFQPLNDGGTRFDTDSRLGLQANYTIDPRFDLVGQLLLTRRMPASTTGDAVAWAFAAYRPTENLTVRAGRLSVNLYQLSDYRSVGLAYPFVRPPGEFYNVLPSAIDGVDASQTWRDGGDAIWKLSGYYGKTKQGDNRTSSYRAVQPLYGIFISREEQGLVVKASVSRGKLTGDLVSAAPLAAALRQLTALPVPQVASDAAALGQRFESGQSIQYIGLGLNLDRDDWLLMIEASRGGVPGLVSIDAGYVLVGHRFARFTPYASVNSARKRVDGSAPQWTAALTPVLGAAGAAQAQALGDLAYTATTFGPRQQTLSLGLRWDLSATTDLKLQYDHTRIGSRGSLFWAHGSDDAASAHVLTATFDFVF